MTTMNTQKEYEVLKIQSAWRIYKAKNELRILKEARDANFIPCIAPYYIKQLIDRKDLPRILQEVYLPESFISFRDNMVYCRHKYTKYYSWAIPDRTSIQAIINFYKINKINYILEIGAGFGLWAGMLSIARVNIKATDIDPNKNLDSYVTEPYTNVESISATDAVEKYQDADCLFICWPAYNEPYAADSVKIFTGKYIVCIGEGHGGCTANDEFFDILEKDWIRENILNIKNWWGIHDRMRFYARK